MITAAHAAGLVTERTIALPNVAGRIDHLASDDTGKILFVAEHDNGTLDVVDLAAGRPIGRINNMF
jgi:hypothetical protein